MWKKKIGFTRGNKFARNVRSTGTLSCWSAGAADALSGSYDWNWSYYTDIEKPIRCRKWTLFPTPPEQLETKRKGRKILTESTQTLCDLVRWDCEIEFVAQAIDWFERDEGNLDRIKNELERRGLLEKYEEEYEPYLQDI